MDTKRDEKCRHLDEFQLRHRTFYTELVRILGDWAERNDPDDLSPHLAYISQIIRAALHLRLIIQPEDQSRGGRA